MPFINSGERELQDFRRQYFGPTTFMPSLYLGILQTSIAGAELALCQQYAGHDPVAFWIKGQTLGYLTCVGKCDEHPIASLDCNVHARITGSHHRLTDPVSVDVVVSKAMGDDDPREVRWWGRVVTVKFATGGSLNIDAVTGEAAQRQQAEDFIDAVLAKIDGG